MPRRSGVLSCAKAAGAPLLIHSSQQKLYQCMTGTASSFCSGPHQTAQSNTCQKQWLGLHSSECIEEFCVAIRRKAAASKRVWGLWSTC